MLKHVIFNINDKQEYEKNSLPGIKSKKKSKSIGRANINKEKIIEQKIAINLLSNQIEKNNEFLSHQNKNKNRKWNLLFHKRNSRIEIDANKPFIKRYYDRKLKLNKENNKENNFITENHNGINGENISKKKSSFKTHDKNEKKEKDINNPNHFFSKFKNIKNISEEKKEEKIEIKQDVNKNISDNIISKEKIENNIEKKEENDDAPLLQLNDINSSRSSIPSQTKKNQSVSSNDITENSSDSNTGIEIKGEFLTKNKKTNFLNNIKKCLFNQNLNINLEEENIDIKKINKINLKVNLSITDLQTTDDNININSSFITKAGIDDKKEKTNQDSYLLLEKLFENKLNIFGVFDGHGVNGHLISSLVSKFLSKYLNNKENYSLKNNNKNDSNSDSDSSISSKEIITITNELLTNLLLKEDFIKKIISELDLKANECDFDLQFSGTTCLLLFILNNYLICSNIGDSICVLFNCSDEDRWTHEMISKIHKPDIPYEKERILSNGGVIHPYYDEYGIFEGPNRVYVKGKTYPGLSLTRSIGDLEAEKIGIISEPEIFVKKLDSTCKYIVMGSDGLWDVIKPYDVRRIVTPFYLRGDPKGACQALLKNASKKWDKEGCERDDITIIVAFIGTPNNNN